MAAGLTGRTARGFHRSSPHGHWRVAGACNEPRPGRAVPACPHDGLRTRSDGPRVYSSATSAAPVPRARPLRTTRPAPAVIRPSTATSTSPAPIRRLRAWRVVRDARRPRQPQDRLQAYPFTGYTNEDKRCSRVRLSRFSGAPQRGHPEVASCGKRFLKVAPCLRPNGRSRGGPRRPSSHDASVFR